MARKLRLAVPLLYALTVPTLFCPWYLAHVQLAEVIFFGLLAVSALSWAVSLVRWAVRSRREAQKLLAWAMKVIILLRAETPVWYNGGETAKDVLAQAWKRRT